LQRVCTAGQGASSSSIAHSGKAQPTHSG
jgi:hypothetical protein